MTTFSKAIQKAFVVVAFAHALACTPGAAQEGNVAAVKARLEEIADSYTAGNAFMGSVLVVDGDRVLLDKGYGMADLQWGIPDAPDVKFRLGSLTKQFTAALVLLLQQEHKLRIEDPVSKYLPDAPKSWEKITFAELLGHTSGIPDFTHDKDFGTWRMSPHSVVEELAFFRDKPLDFEPGSTFQYSNSNCCAKGGSSVLADACLAHGGLSEEESCFSFEWGVLLQLGDDLQDVREDLRSDSVTLFSHAAALGTPLDNLATQLLRFSERVGARMDDLTCGSRMLKDLLRTSWRSLIVGAVADSHEFFSPGFLRVTEQSFPFRFEFLRARRKRLASREGLYSALFEAFLEARQDDDLELSLPTPLLQRCDMLGG